MISIIFVPDVQNQASKTWLDDSWDIVQFILPTDVSSLVLGFEYSICIGSDSIWNTISSEASTLVDCLAQQSDIHTVSAPPGPRLSMRITQWDD